MVMLYRSGGITQKDIARRHRVKPRLVFDLVREARCMPDKKREEKDKRKEATDRREAVRETAAAILAEGRPIASSSQVCLEVSANSNHEVSSKFVQRVLREDLKLSFVKTKRVLPQSNSARVLIQRQQFALTLLRLLEAGTRVINVDETWLNESSYQRRTWAPRDGMGNAKLNTVTPRLSMIAALDTDGKSWLSLAHATTDSNMIALFLQHLTRALELESPGWRDDTVLLWDNATYHKSAETKAVVETLGIQVLHTGPYSYSGAPIELLFAALKLGELNAEGQPTGKR